ncbi:MAG: glycine cleavage system aminomethyltransferase GcvT [Bauldia litoralis]
MSEADSYLRTPLYDLHVALGGRMVPFAGYELPVQYSDGIIAEHTRTRTAAALFDVSHMGQAVIVGDDAVDAIEALVPGDIAGLDRHQIRYTQLTNDAGGIIDDLMVTRLADGVGLVVNGARKDVDYAHLDAALAGTGCQLEPQAERALLALQGPQAVAALGRHAPGCDKLCFMQAGAFDLGGVTAWISRSGYTGEDGFEISVPGSQAIAVAERLLAEPEVGPAGLGARDSLRLEAGLCLWGHDIDETTTPVEAALTWSVGKRRRAEGGFPGDAVILHQIEQGAPRKRVGLRPEGRAPAREGAEVTDTAGGVIGTVTSGGFGPTVGAPVAMGYVDPGHAKPDTPVQLMVRGKALAAHVAKLPFVQPNYVRP